MPTLQIYTRDDLYEALSNLTDAKKGVGVKQVALAILDDFVRSPRLTERWAALQRKRPVLDA